MSDYYQILGVSWIDTTQTIRKHYYKRARDSHPDKFDGDPEKCEAFKHLSEAYSTLSNPKKRYLYDISRLCRRIGVALDVDPIHLEDEDLETLSTYYNRFRNSTECKFLYTLLRSVPRHNGHNEYLGLNRRRGDTAPCSYIEKRPQTLDGRLVEGDYTVTLRRDLKDVYAMRCKEVLIMTKDRCDRIFVTHSDYCLHFKNGDASLHIEIHTHIEDPLISRQGYDIYVKVPRDLYQFFFETNIVTGVFHRYYQCAPQQLSPDIYRGRGLHDPSRNQKGDLYLCPQLVYHMNHRVAKDHMELVKTLLSTK